MQKLTLCKNVHLDDWTAELAIIAFDVFHPLDRKGTLVRDRDKYQDPLFPIVPDPFPVLPSVLVTCTVNKSIDRLSDGHDLY